jgi:DUF177 domain-containing protein
LNRLKEVLLEDKGELEYSMTFDIDESGITKVEVEIEVQLTFVCQRCLEPVVIEIHKNSSLGIVNDKDEFEALPKEYEPLQLDEDNLSVEQLVEDELLLAIPLSPLHSADECPGKRDLDKINADSKLKPFAGLAVLKNK